MKKWQTIDGKGERCELIPDGKWSIQNLGSSSSSDSSKIIHFGRRRRSNGILSSFGTSLVVSAALLFLILYWNEIGWKSGKLL